MTEHKLLQAISDRAEHYASITGQQLWNLPVRERARCNIARNLQACESGLQPLFGGTHSQADRMAHSRLLSRMEASGLIERLTPRYVALTDAGREMLQQPIDEQSTETTA